MLEIPRRIKIKNESKKLRKKKKTSILEIRLTNVITSNQFKNTSKGQ